MLKLHKDARVHITSALTCVHSAQHKVLIIRNKET